MTLKPHLTHLVFICGSCSMTICLACGHLMNHKLVRRCDACGSDNVTWEYEENP